MSESPARRGDHLGARRRRWSVEEKIRLVEETLGPGMSVSFVALHGLSPSLLFNRRQRVAAGGREAVRFDDEVIGAARVRQLEEAHPGLERLLGRDPQGRDPQGGARRGAGKLLLRDRRTIRMVRYEGHRRHPAGRALEPGRADDEARREPAATPYQGRRRRLLARIRRLVDARRATATGGSPRS